MKNGIFGEVDSRTCRESGVITYVCSIGNEAEHLYVGVGKYKNLYVTLHTMKSEMSNDVIYLYAYYCPNEVNGYTINGVNNSFNPCQTARYKVMILDCEVKIFETGKMSFENLKEVWLGEHFKASEEMMKTIIEDLWKKNPALRKKFPIFKYINGPEVNVNKYMPTIQPRVITFEYEDYRTNRKKQLKVQTLDENIKVGSEIEVRHTMFHGRETLGWGDKPYIWYRGVVVEVDTPFSGFVENLDIISKVLSYDSDYNPNQVPDYLEIIDVDNKTLKVNKKGKLKKFKELKIPSFEDKDVIIIKEAFKNCTISKLIIECRIVKVEKGAFEGTKIKKIEGYKNVPYNAIEDEIFRLNVARMALKDYKPGSSKNYLAGEIFNNDLYALIERYNDEFIYPNEDAYLTTLDRLITKGLFKTVDFNKIPNLKQLASYYKEKGNALVYDSELKKTLLDIGQKYSN